jgi:hypothetical protein
MSIYEKHKSAINKKCVKEKSSSSSSSSGSSGSGSSGSSGSSR